MSQNLTELCELLVQNHVGDLCAQIFTTLAHHGRSTLTTLATHAQIPVRRVRTGLANLIEAQLVNYVATEEDGPTFYSVSWDAAYNLARHGNVISWVTERYGEGAGQMVKNILQLGTARVGDLAEAYDLQPALKRDSGIDATTGVRNGTTDPHLPKNVSTHHVTSASEFHRILGTLLKIGILVKVGARTFMPLSDLQEQLEETVISEQFPDRKVTGPKKKAQFETAVSTLKRKWQNDDAFSETYDYDFKGNMKRPGEHFTGPNKRAKLNGGTINGNARSEGEVPKLSSDLVVRVNFTRCSIGLRSARLQNLAKRFLGEATAAVYGALLQALENKTKSLHIETPRDDEDTDLDDLLPVVTSREVGDCLDPEVDLDDKLASKSKHEPNGVGKKSGKNHANGILGDGYNADSKDEPTNGYTSYRDFAKRSELIEVHLGLLEEHSKCFCKRTRPGAKYKGWIVPYPVLTDTLLADELDAIILARYGRVHLRLVRLLRDRGKLDEKAVGSIAMMRVKDVRGLLAEMQYQGLLEAQEVPKDNHRAPSKTIFLWYFDTSRVQSLLLQQTYKAMARSLQRVEVERAKNRTIIEKAERSDIKGMEQEKLQQPEKIALRHWREIEERLLTQVARMDEVVCVLRDFSGRDVSLAS